MAWLLVVVTIVVLCWAGPSAALDPARSIAQYKHTKWTIGDGVPPEIKAFAQTKNGYLWIGSGRGLYRFDGLTFERIPPIVGDKSRSGLVTALLAARSGDVWVGYYWGGISVFRDGRLQDANHGPPIGAVGAIVEDADGGIWVATHGLKLAQLSRFAYGKWEVFNESEGVPDGYISGLAAGSDGTVWIVSKGAPRFLSRGSHHFQVAAVRSMPPPPGIGDAPDGLAADPHGRVWLVNGGGVQLLKPVAAVEDAASTETNGAPLNEIRGPRSMIIDRDGSVWAASATKGVVRFQQPGMITTGMAAFPAQGQEFFGASEGLTDDVGAAVLEDREGDVWVGTANGIDLFRPATLVTETRVPLRSSTNYLALTDRKGVLYITADSRLYRIAPGTNAEFRVIPSPILGQARTMCEDHDGVVWIMGSGGVQQLDHGRLITADLPIPPSPNGVAYCEGTDDAMWIGVNQQGLFRYAKGKLLPFPVFADTPRRTPYILSDDGQGNLLADFPRKALVRITPAGQVQTLWQGAVDPVGFLRVIAPGKNHVLLGGETGLARLEGDRVTALSSAEYPWMQGISGIAETEKGDTWLFAADGVLHLSTAELQAAFDRPGLPLHVRLYDAGDGLSSFAAYNTSATAREDSSGRIWFLGLDRAFWIDPAHVARNALPPPVSIRALLATSRKYLPGTHPVLDAGTTRIEIDYTALSLQAPDRVQFRYRLDGLDKDWVDPGNRRQAFYTNLAPGHYSFHVIAANNDGVWNNTGASVDFDLLPTFWQTKSFAALCCLGGTALLWALYALRLHQVTGRLRLRMEERLAERERIARELHDTLLQGFHGLVLRFQAVAERIPPEQANRLEADAALDRADQVLSEGRDRVLALRAAGVSADLRQTLEAVAEYQRLGDQARVTVNAAGEPRPLHVVAADEIVHIAREALFNSFRHAAASCIGIDIAYGRKQLEVRLCDDGAGIDRAIVERGLAGHYGLTGMRERARKVQATLNIVSAPGAGTAITLIVPASVAYAEPADRFRATAGWQGALRRVFAKAEHT